MSTFLMIGRVLQRTCLKLPSNCGSHGLANGSMIPLGIRSPFEGLSLNQTRCYAARRGTREKARKIKAARKLKEIKKDLAPVGTKFASKVKVTTRDRLKMYHPTREPVDDVWLFKFNKRKSYPIIEAVEMHRELHHPTMLNLPDAPLYLLLELDMSLEKKSKFIDAFSGIVANPHYFSDGKNRAVLAFCKDEKGQTEAMAAGANLAGSSSLIKQVQSGEVIASEFNYVVANPDILGDLSVLRGILKKLYPSAAKGSLGMNMRTLVERFKMGIEFTVQKDSIQHNFGFTEINVGPLSMPAEHLEANIGAVVEHVCTQRMARLGPFITAAALLCPPTRENFLIDVSKYMPQVPVEKDDDEGEAEEAIKQ